jgi:sugar-specific transcriptional regulator TrmB
LNFDDAQTLMHLGLTNSQAKVYLALLRLSTDNKGATIAKFADVPRQDVYRLLDELQQIGIVEKTLSRPATFRNVPPKETASILLQRRQTDFSLLEREAADFVERAKNIACEPPEISENDQFMIISEREAIACRAREATDNMQVSLDDITPLNEMVPWLTMLSKSIDKALSRGVKIRWITEEPADKSSIAKFVRDNYENRNFELRFSSCPLTAKIGIIDRKEIILANSLNDGFGRSPALWSNNHSIAMIAESYFETCWKSSHKLKHR